MVVQESLGTRPFCCILRLSYQSRVLHGSRATQPTLPAGPTSTTIVLYVDSVPHREKELALTSFGHMRAFNSLSHPVRKPFPLQLLHKHGNLFSIIAGVRFYGIWHLLTLSVWTFPNALTTMAWRMRLKLPSFQVTQRTGTGSTVRRNLPRGRKGD